MGLVEGITEWLPVSSTGHMILVDEFVKMNVSETFWNMFLVVIQLGAILAVCVLFFHELNPFSPSKGKEGRRDTWVLWGKIVLGCIPAAAIGLPLNDWMEEHFYNAPVVALALIVYGVLFIVIENWRANKREEMAVAGLWLLSIYGYLHTCFRSSIHILPGNFYRPVPRVVPLKGICLPISYLPVQWRRQRH